MWKKISIAFIAFVSTISLVYNLRTSLSAANTPTFEVNDGVLIGGLTFYVTEVDEANKKIHFMTSRLTGYDEYTGEGISAALAMFNMDGAMDEKGKYLKETSSSLSVHIATSEDILRMTRNSISAIAGSNYIWAESSSCAGPQFDSGKYEAPPYYCGYDTGNNNSHGASIAYLTAGTPWALGYALAFDVDLKSVEFKNFYESGNAYVFDDNVNSGHKVGVLETSNLSSAATVSLIASQEASNANDAGNFILTKNGSNYDLKIANNGTSILDFNNDTKSLKSGTYKFTIHIEDGANFKNDIPVSINVQKKNSTVSFSDEEKIAIKTGGDAISQEITTNMNDLASNDASAPVYSLEGGVTGTGLTVVMDPTNAKAFNVSVGQTALQTLPATFTLRVTLPETENRNSSTATKQILVYNPLTALTWAPSKTNFAPSDVVSGQTVGKLEANGGYGPFTYELVDSQDAKYDPTAGADNGSFTIVPGAIESGKKNVKTNTSLAVGEYHVQFKVKDALQNTAYVNAVIKVDASAQEALLFKNTAGGTEITSYSLTYPDSSKSLIAEGGSGTGAITYTLAPAENQPENITNASDYLEVGLNDGSLTPKKPGTVIVRATKAGDSNYSSTYVDMPVEIVPATQKLTWTGTNVTQVSNSTDTWKLETYWSGETDTINIQELLNSDATATDLGISTNVPDASADVPFQLSLSATGADSELVSLSSNTITITGKPSSVVQIKAERAKDNGYADSAPAYLNLVVKSLPDIKFTYDVRGGCSGSMAAASTCTLNGKKLGDLSLDPVTSGFTFSIESVEYDSTGTGNSYTAAIGVFTLANGKEINITSDLNNGKYRIKVKATDGTYTLTELTTVLTISNNAFDTGTWTWDAGDTETLQAVAGEMDGTTNVFTGIYKKEYSPAVGGIKDQFRVELKGIPNGASVAYKVRETSDLNVISHAANAVFYVDGAGGTRDGNNTVFIEAVVSKNGYSDVSVFLPVEIEKYAQTIGFANSTAIFLPNNGVCTTIPSATVTSTNSNYASPGNPIKYKVDDAYAEIITVSGNQICSIAGTTSTSAKVKAELDGNTNYEKATAQKNVVLYTPGTINVTESIASISGGASNITYTEGTHIVAHDSSVSKNGTASQNTKVANIKLTGLAGSASYQMSTGTGDANQHKNYFDVHPTSGNITLKQDITASDIFAHQGNIFFIQIDVKDPHGFVQTVNVQIVIDDAIAKFYFQNDGEELPTTGAGSGMYVDNQTGVAKYSETYAKDGTITKIETNRGDAAYSVDDNPLTASDVIELASGNTYNILNATDGQAEHGGKAYAKACIEAGSGYQAQCIYAEVEIKKAEQTGFAFMQNPLNLTTSSGEVTPIYRNHFDGQDVLISNSSDPSIVDAGTYTEGSDQGIQVFAEGGPVTITATTAGSRNYVSASAQTIVNVTERPLQTLIIDVNPKPIYYGETAAQAKITSGYKSEFPAYFTSSDTSVIDVNDSDTSDDISGALIIKKAGTVDIEVCQTDQEDYTIGDSCPGDYGYKTITVRPKPITLKLKEETIYTGEAFPAYAFESEPISGAFAGSDAISNFPLPANTKAMNGDNILANTDIADNYPIQGSYSTEEKAGAFLSNYNVTIQNGTLSIKQDDSAQSWYNLEGATSGTILLDSTKWYNEDIYVKLNASEASADAGTYNEISDTPAFINEDKTKYLVTNEDDNTKDVYFRIDPNGETNHAGAISSKQTTSIKIDKTKPRVTGAKGTPSTNNLLEDIINAITLNTFFKPGVEVILSTTDPQPQQTVQTVNVSGVRDVDYTIYEVNERTGTVDVNSAPRTGSGRVDENGEIKFTIPNVGAYKVCAIAHDNAGNDSLEECYYVNVKKINIDEDDDGILDFNDSDANGCPDLNIILGEDSSGNKVKLNIAEENKKYPYMNIDSDGDGKPDLNVDTDHDGRPDLNLVIMSESQWKPEICVVKEELNGYSDPVEYCTGTDAKPQINVVVDNREDDIKNQTPSLNIDTTGDMKADFNIDINDDGKADVNIGKAHTLWKPDKDYVHAGFEYDTMLQDKPLLNVDSDGDGRPDLNIDLDKDGEPDINIDADGNGIPETNIDSKGDGKPDINIDTNGDGKADENIIEIKEWNPQKDVDGKIKYDTMSADGNNELEDNGIVVEKPDGTFLPNSAIKVNDISSNVESAVKNKIHEIAGDQEIKKIYGVEYLEDNVTKQPNGKVNIKIPVDPLIKNAKILVEKEDGSFEEVKAIEQDGYYVFETDYIGKVSILGDPDESTDPKPTTNPSTVDKEEPSTSVKGTYTTMNNGMGGANTGDETQFILYMIVIIISLGTLSFMFHRRSKE